MVGIISSLLGAGSSGSGSGSASTSGSGSSTASPAPEETGTTATPPATGSAPQVTPDEVNNYGSDLPEESDDGAYTASPPAANDNAGATATPAATGTTSSSSAAASASTTAGETTTRSSRSVSAANANKADDHPAVTEEDARRHAVEAARHRAVVGLFDASSTDTEQADDDGGDVSTRIVKHYYSYA